MAMREPEQSASWRYVAPATMDATLFQQWTNLLEERTGIALPEARKTFLITNLAIRMRELNLTDYQQYYDLIMSGQGGQIEWEILVDRLTVHETRFYRDTSALNYVRDMVLPRLVREHPSPYTVNVWSVGCATGEEPYSLAMILDTFFAQLCTGFYYGVTASDISRAALQTGRKAIYHKHRIKNVPDTLVRHYLQTVDAEHVQVNAELRQHVCFVPINLLHLDSHSVTPMDVIVCQNVLIYFKQELRQQILNNLVNQLKPGGVLIPGPGETMGWSHPELETVVYQNMTVYHRRNHTAGGQ